MSLTNRIGRSLRARIGGVRSNPLLSSVARSAHQWEAQGGSPANDSHHVATTEAIDWLVRAQDATPDAGFSRAYSVIWNPYFKAAGWQPSYPETTGYIIPTMYSAARFTGRPDLAARATAAARWEITVQMANGAVQGGVIGQKQSPAIFNTGMVVLGWLSALEETGDMSYADATTRACDFLLSVEENGNWVKGNSEFARKDATAYNARAAWALAEAGRALYKPEYTDAAARILRAVGQTQQQNGWFPNCCLNDPSRPLLHTLAYTIRGLLEGGRVLEDSRLIDYAARASLALAARVRADGWMSGRFDSGWANAADWTCLTGQAQMANNWMRFHEITRQTEWLKPVEPVMNFLMTKQNRSSHDLGFRGGIAGSSPIKAEYGRYEILNWATKYFADALMRQAAVNSAQESITVSRLA